ncbi:nucleotide sugar dehydrogenase [Aspergillus bertholletiae]|uniref:UDP-glucose 6-dehydrogenase n=1 Tax=Aspergillus bertholletiae TaxID=1226010 RepID=A0A5N7B8R9_9EURO|nr:nucleotide sugar dehydrogenase [Aspergillus bertholletiae]
MSLHLQLLSCSKGSAQETLLTHAEILGALTAIVLALKNPDVKFTIVDKNEGLISSWNSNHLPLFEPGLEEIFFDEPQQKVHKDGRSPRRRRLPNVTFSTTVDASIVAADMIFICVNTPLHGSFHIERDWKGLDLSNIKAVAERIAAVSVRHQTVVLKSTVPCGMANHIKQMLEKKVNVTASFDVISSPEFLAQGSAIRGLLSPNRVVIGDATQPTEAVAAIRSLYGWVPTDRIITVNVWSSELAKIASNAFIAQRISSINSMSAVCESSGANVHDISQIVGSEPRIGPLSLRAGFGFGGSCLYKDVCCLIYLAQELGLSEVADYWKSVIRLNDWQNRRILERIVSFLPSAAGGHNCGKVAVLGLTFKKDTLDTRNSAAIDLVQGLRQCGVKVHLYDPRLRFDQVECIFGSVTSEMMASSIEDACRGCHALVIHTNWDEFADYNIRWELISSSMMDPKVLLDPWGVTNHGAMRRHGFRIMDIGIRRLQWLKDITIQEPDS